MASSTSRRAPAGSTIPFPDRSAAPNPARTDGVGLAGGAGGWVRVVGIVLGALVVVVGLGACSPARGGAGSEGPSEGASGGPSGSGVGPVVTNARVARVTDGDTIHVERNGHDETIRLIGIDTPETKKPNHPVECFGPEASARLTALLPVGTAVRLERDAEARDTYDRTLAYVYRDDGLFVNLAMVADGYAGTLAIAPNVAHAPELGDAARAARGQGTGLWGACGGNHVVR